MAKVTSKLQVTIPKSLARQYKIEPGDEIEFRPAGTEIRVVRPGLEPMRLSVAERLRLFEDARARQRDRERSMSIVKGQPGDRGWTRDELYARGRAAEAGLPEDGSRREE
jgi:AbrB family looped-hinge helix DNA binding protein